MAPAMMTRGSRQVTVKQSLCRWPGGCGVTGDEGGRAPPARPQAEAVPRPKRTIHFLVLQRRLVISGPAGVVRLAGGGLPVASPVGPLLVECPRAGEAGVQVEQAAGLGGGERDQVTPGLPGYEWRRGVCSRRGERAARSCQAPFSAGA